MLALQSFIGTAKTSIDSKGRTSFPREFRRFLLPEDGGSVVVGPGPSRSLVLYTELEWNHWMSELQGRPRSEENSRFIMRQQKLSHVSELDGQNRISLTREQMEYAMLASDVVFSGRTGKTCSLWNPERYEELFGIRSDEDYKEIDAGFFGGSGQGSQG